MSKKLGKLVREARTAKGMTQAQLADKVDGLTASDVSKIERGEKEPAEAVVKLMAKALGVTQVSLVSAMSGKSSAAKTGIGKTGTASGDLKLTAAEKKLLNLYRKADADTKKAAMDLLAGESSSLADILGALLGKQSGKKQDDTMSAMLSGLMEMLKKQS